MAANTITLDRELVERFVVEVDALASLDNIRNGNEETALATHVYSILEPFERAAFGPMGDEEAGALHDRAHERGAELAREWFGPLFEQEADDAR